MQCTCFAGQFDELQEVKRHLCIKQATAKETTQLSSVRVPASHKVQKQAPDSSTSVRRATQSAVQKLQKFALTANGGGGRSADEEMDIECRDIGNDENDLQCKEKENGNRWKEGANEESTMETSTATSTDMLVPVKKEPTDSVHSLKAGSCAVLEKQNRQCETCGDTLQNEMWAQHQKLCSLAQLSFQNDRKAKISAKENILAVTFAEKEINISNPSIDPLVCYH